MDPVWWFNEANSLECVLHFRDVDCHAMETVLISNHLLTPAFVSSFQSVAVSRWCSVSARPRPLNKGFHILTSKYYQTRRRIFS